MGVSWTSEQQKVIDIRDHNVLVSAAAGSGKTAVLVERIIKRITDRHAPVDIDRLLVVTFTNAAAAEMRERVRDAIEKALDNDPENVHLQKQYTLLHNAQITTIDSFCLYIIRNYFHKIDLEPAFRVGDQGEFELLESDVLDQVMEAHYEAKAEDFIHFIKSFGAAKSDEPVRKMILELFRYSRSYPWPKEWLESCVLAYQAETMEELEEKSWMKALLSCIRAEISELLAQMDQCIRITQAPDGPYMYEEIMQLERNYLGELSQAETYRELAEKIQTPPVTRLPVKRNFEGSEEKKEQVKAIREEVKGELKKLREKYFFSGEEAILESLKKTCVMAEVLVRLTEEFSDRFAETKKEKNLVDFSDMEHFALNILVDEETKEPTEVALEFKELFAEIMVDEYQDSNYVQEAILTAIAKKLPETPDMFMVGDVKQSIYRFRLARPELFMDKYERFAAGEEGAERIDLHKNFRSRKEVIDPVNDIFYKIMKKDLGRVEYDEDAALYAGASYPENEGLSMEILVAENGAESLEEAEQEDRVELEAAMIASKIRELIKNQQVTDKESGMLRKTEYQDIVILLRSLSGWADPIASYLNEQGIPAYTASQTGYFSTPEIQILLSMLAVIDNPGQDIPLAAVLHSPIGGFTAEELAKFRIHDREHSFAECVFGYAECGEDAALREKTEDFLALLEELRRISVYTPIHELITEVLHRTDYLNYVSALPAGKQKRANVEMLVEKAAAYENTSYHGLFHFIRYIDKLQKYDVDFGEADVVNENENAVRIMSIHKSKGLEFPVVFVSGMGKQFNMQDTRGKLVLHPEYGMGMDCMDDVRHTKTPTMVKRALSRLVDDENLGEELRILYVALTRAKEKLILTGTMKKADETLEAAKRTGRGNEPLSFLQRTKAKCYFDWVLPALLSDYKITVMTPEDLKKEAVSQAVSEAVLGEHFLRLSGEPSEKDEWIRKRLDYRYPYEAEKNVKTKVSVSELKHQAMIFEEGEAETIQWFEPEKKESVVPLFAAGSREVNRGALRGSAVHRVMECFPFGEARAVRKMDRTAREAFIAEKLGAMLLANEITEEMKELVSIPGIDVFLQSRLAGRMCEADEKGLLFKEKPFVMGLDAGEIYHNDSRETVLIQGIIDVFFYEGDKVILMDYKTDSVERPEQLVKRYETQLDLYEEALRRVTGKETAGKIIYSFHLGCEIPL